MIKILNLAKHTEILLYDEIGFFGTDASDFTSELKEKHTPGNKLVVRINSPGGSVTDGIAIFNQLKRIGNVEVHIDGIAASIASYIAMSGDSIIMADNAFMMIHNPNAFTGGDSDDLRRTADLMDSMRDVIATAYVNKTGLAAEDINALMENETWLTATEALEKGFVDSIGESIELAANAGGFSKYDTRNFAVNDITEITIDKTETENKGDVNPMKEDNVQEALAAKQVEILNEKVSELTAQLETSKREKAIVDTRADVTAALADATDLSELFKARISNEFKGAESSEGLAKSIEDATELTVALTTEIKANLNTEDTETAVIGLGPDTQVTNENETTHEARIQNWLKINDSDDYRAALIATSNLEG